MNQTLTRVNRTVVARVTMAVRDWLGSWSSGDKVLAALLGRGPTTSGVNVTEETALTVSAVWACVQLIAGNLASLPLIHYRRTGTNSRDRATDTRLYHLLHDQPNEEMSAPTFLETLQSHVLLWGNAFAEIRRNGRGEVASLYPIESWRVSGIRQAGIAGPLFYRVAQPDGSAAVLSPDEMLHVPGLTTNGVWGMSVIGKARESFGLALAEEQFSASFFGKGSTFGGVLSHPGTLSPVNEDRLRASLEARHQGVDRAHQFVILQGGMKYEKLGVPARDAQFLQQRQFQTAEVARWFGVPPHLIGDVERSTSWGSGIQQQTIGFLQFTLRRWLVKWEKELNRKLISPLERNLQFIEFLVDGLERGDQESRYRAYQIGLASGFVTRNEVRGFENLPRVENGDELLVPLNMTTLDAMVKAADAPLALPAQPPEPPDDEDDEEEEEAVQQLASLEATMVQLRADVERIGTRPDPVLDLTPVLEQMERLQPPPAVDLAPVLEKLDRLDAKPEPPPVDLGPVLEQIERLDAKPAPPPPTPVDLGPVLEKLERLDAKPAPPPVDLAPVLEQLDRIDAKPAPPAPPPVDLAPVLARIEAASAEIITATPAAVNLDPLLSAIEAVLEAVQAVRETPAPPQPDLSPVVERLASLEQAHQAADTARRDRLAAVLPGVEAWLLMASTRYIKREADRARKAAISAEKLASWAATFYARQGDYAVKELRGPVEVCLALSGRTGDAEAEIRERVLADMTGAQGAIAGLLQAPPEDLRAAVEALAAQWEQERPAALIRGWQREVVHGA